MEKLLEENGRLAFCSLTPTISKTFEIMGLVQYATIYPDQEAARADLEGHAAD
jgi:anti-anti-sigma regulatory factor